MGKSKNGVIKAFFIILCAAVIGAYMLYADSYVHGINSSEATEIVLSDPNASEYYSSYFQVEEWRVTTTTLVDATPNGSTSEDGVWKVEIMERTCACSTVKPLLVIEGYVSASNGELFEVSTKYVSESEYDKETCSSTACH